MTKLAFVDTETTGLDPHRHQIWEVGLIVRDSLTTNEYTWQLDVDLGRADPMALDIGRFHERRWPTAHSNEEFKSALLGTGHRLHEPLMPEWARQFVELTRSVHLVGAVVSFDAERLWKLLRRLGQCPMWHYHLIDVETLAAGWLAAPESTGWPDAPVDVHRPPWDSTELSLAVGVDPERFDRHTALGDARWAMAIYDAVMS
jgi:oligoribonuclease (3'-5' exoribonuclease)